VRTKTQALLTIILFLIASEINAKSFFHGLAETGTAPDQAKQ